MVTHPILEGTRVRALVKSQSLTHYIKNTLNSTTILRAKVIHYHEIGIG